MTSDETRPTDAERREAFERWLFAMDDTLERFRAGVPDDLRRRLDHSLASLEAVEAFTLDRYAAIEDIRAPEEAQMHDGLAIYVGETIRRRTGGGTWDLPLSDPDGVHYRIPVLRGVPGSRSDVAPMTLVTAAIDRRRGSYLHDLIARWADRARVEAPG